MEPTAEEINQFFEYFHSIYDENGKEINPVPDGRKVTVWCSDGESEEGFGYDLYFEELGINAFIAKAWIEQERLEELMKKNQ